MSGDLIDDTLWSGTYTEDRSTSTRDLCAACVVNNLCTDSQTHSLSLQYLELLLALDLHGHLGLPVSFPLAQNILSGGLLQKSLVAGECRMTTLGSNLTCRWNISQSLLQNDGDIERIQQCRHGITHPLSCPSRFEQPRQVYILRCSWQSS